MPDGRFLSVEAKIGKAKPTQEQKDFIALVISKGGVAGAVWSVEEFIALVRDAQ
jgi:hypothetical protein